MPVFGNCVLTAASGGGASVGLSEGTGEVT